MELRKGPVALYKIFLGAFSVALNSFGSIVLLFILMILAVVAVGGLFYWIGFFSPKQLLASSILFTGFIIYLSCWFYMGMLRVMESKADTEGRQTPEALIGAILPGFYMLLLMGVMTLLMGGLGLILRSATNVSQVLTMYIIGMLIMLFLIFVPQALALRQQNPITAIVYSAQLVKSHYLRVLAMVIISILIPLAFVFLSLAAISTFLIPALVESGYMKMTGGFQQFSNLPGILFFVLYFILYTYFCFVAQAMHVLLFLNLDFQDNYGASGARDTHYTTASFVPNANLAGEQVEVLQSSIATNANSREMQKHLDTVCTDIGSQSEDSELEEDRMPTILFDDVMAKEVAKNKQFWDEKTKKQKELEATSNEPDEPDETNPIKMSQMPKIEKED